MLPRLCDSSAVAARFHTLFASCVCCFRAQVPQTTINRQARVLFAMAPAKNFSDMCAVLTVLFAILCEELFHAVGCVHCSRALVISVLALPAFACAICHQTTINCRTSHLYYDRSRLETTDEYVAILREVGSLLLEATHACAAARCLTLVFYFSASSQFHRDVNLLDTVVMLFVLFIVRVLACRLELKYADNVRARSREAEGRESTRLQTR